MEGKKTQKQEEETEIFPQWTLPMTGFCLHCSHSFAFRYLTIIPSESSFSHIIALNPSFRNTHCELLWTRDPFSFSIFTTSNLPLYYTIRIFEWICRIEGELANGNIAFV
jgi:hypothetical protein